MTLQNLLRLLSLNKEFDIKCNCLDNKCIISIRDNWDTSKVFLKQTISFDDMHKVDYSPFKSYIPDTLENKLEELFERKEIVKEEKTLVDEINLLKGKEKSISYKIVFLTTLHSDFFIIKIEPSFPLDLLDGEKELSNIISNKKELDKINEIGVYSGVLEVASIECNHPEDPTEYDVIINLTKVKLIY